MRDLLIYVAGLLTVPVIRALYCWIWIWHWHRDDRMVDLRRDDEHDP